MSTAELRSALRKSEKRCADLGAQNRELRKRNEEIRNQNTALVSELKTLRREFNAFRAEIKELTGHVPNSKHITDDGQLSLFDNLSASTAPPDDLPDLTDVSLDDEDGDDAYKNKRKPKKRARKTDKSVLPREVVRHELPEADRVCPDTGVELVEVGVQVTEELDYRAAQLRVIEHRRVIYGAPPEVAEERQIAPITAPAPIAPLEGCMASAMLLTHLIIHKYAFHLPLYRQEEVFQQAGLFIARSTLCDWVMKAAFALLPIARAIGASIRAGPVLQLDDTPVKCQTGKDEKNKHGKAIRQAYLWSFVNPAVPGVAFRFTKGRSTDDLAPLLVGAGASILLGDAYAANRAAAKKAGLKFEYAGCWAHVLRKFEEALMEARSMARLFLADVGALYDIENDGTARDLNPEERAELRREKARPVIARMLARTLGWKETFSLSGKMAAAIKYLRNNRKALTTYLSDGGVPIDNNACERSIRPAAVGRRNWLFVGSVQGGEAAATIFTLIESCKAADVELVPYLSDVLVRVATHPASRIDELTPTQWRAVDVVATVG